MKEITGGVCAAQGFLASGVHCGIRKNKDKKDIALIVSEKRAAAASVYTQNLVKGAPIIVTQNHISDGYATAVLCNSGNANTCNANGIEIAEEMCKLVEEHAGVPAPDVIVASTGVIGQPLSLTPFQAGMENLVNALGNNSTDAAEAIMTTDLIKKEVAVSFEIDHVTCKLGGIAKGSGMIHPNMATMLAFITTDVSITPQMLQKALGEIAQNTFNMISIDGDTSTNDMASILANGMAQNAVIDAAGEAYDIFKQALQHVTTKLCKMMAKDGEGATKLLECNVTGAKDPMTAKTAAKAVICSNLVKAAMFGADANWGRVLCAIGYSGADVNVNTIDVAFQSGAGNIAVCADGAGVMFSEQTAKDILSQDEIQINIDLKSGTAAATAWGCDLTYDYVRINGDYRT